ncbi:MAG: hypothetical protein ACKVP0_02815 [Pirellulaceae bacterium]
MNFQIRCSALFAPGELVSPERGFANQQAAGKEPCYRRAGPAGAIFPANAASQKHRSARTSRAVAWVEGWFRVLVPKHRSGGASPPGAEPTNPQDVERRAQLAKAFLCDLFVPGMILATASRTLLAREGTRGLL